MSKMKKHLSVFGFVLLALICLPCPSQPVAVKGTAMKPAAKEIVKYIKDAKLKVQASIHGETVRVSGKDRDTLQETIAQLKAKDLDIDMQFDNFRSN